MRVTGSKDLIAAELAEDESVMSILDANNMYVRGVPTDNKETKQNHQCNIGAITKAPNPQIVMQSPQSTNITVTWPKVLATVVTKTTPQPDIGKFIELIHLSIYSTYLADT